MQFGFGKKTKKRKNKKKGNAKPTAADDEVTMADAEQMDTGAEMVDAAEEAPLTAKEKQRNKMELKKALRVKVNNLKSTRTKQIKAKKPMSKDSKLNMKAEVKQLLQEQLNIGKSGGS